MGRPKGVIARMRHVWPGIVAMIRPRWRILAVGLVLMLLSRLAALVLPISTKYLVDDVFVQRNFSALRPILLAVLAASIIQGCASFVVTRFVWKLAHELVAELRLKVQAHIGRLPLAFYDVNKTGTLVARIMNDVEAVRHLLGPGMMDFAGSLLTAVIVLVVLFRTSALMTVVALTILLTFVFMLRSAFKLLRSISLEASQINAEVTGRLNESLGGVRVIKGYHAEERERKVFANGVEKLLDNIFKGLNATSVLGLATTVLIGVVSVVVCYLGAQQIFAGRLMLGDFVKYATLLTFLVTPAFQVVNIGTQITQAVAGLDRTREVLSEKPEDEDDRRTVVPPTIEGLIEFEHVYFKYQDGAQALSDVSFVAKPGSVTALVGPSGSGKSTIIGLVAAFHTPKSGAVRIDGVDLTTLKLGPYRQQLGVVLQETFLFDGTIWENVAFSRPSAAREEILESCRIACVDEFAERFTEGYETIIGERGVKLSGGQRQRISIARAILAAPRILILDEATSNLDAESERFIERGLRYLMKGRTTIVAAHRLSTIKRANQIIVVEEGRIVEQGTHGDLYAAKGRYWDLYTEQQEFVANIFPAESCESRIMP